MIDIVGILKSKDLKVEAKQNMSTVLFYETSQCRELVEEAFRFESLEIPALIENKDELIQQHVRESSIEVVVVELNKSQNVTKDMERISHLLPNHASVIVIGSEDAISTIRGLKAMGFYYLFWPITKQELTDFIKNVYENRSRNYGLGQNRKAKRVSVWGSKGGVGTSLFTSEIAKELSESRNATGVVVDHNFGGGNLDIMLGLKQFKKRELIEASVLNGVDEQSALGMTQKVNPLLSMLATESDVLSNDLLETYTRQLSDALASNANFLIHDLSGKGYSKECAEWVANNSEVVVVVLDPTIGSIRDAAKLINQLKNSASKARVVVVLNHTKPEKNAPLSKSEIEDFIKVSVDTVCPFDAKVVQHILKGNTVYNSNLPIAKSINVVTSIILGEKTIKKKNNFWKFK